MSEDEENVIVQSEENDDVEEHDENNIVGNDDPEKLNPKKNSVSSVKSKVSIASLKENINSLRKSLENPDFEPFKTGKDQQQKDEDKASIKSGTPIKSGSITSKKGSTTSVKGINEKKSSKDLSNKSKSSKDDKDKLEKGEKDKLSMKSEKSRSITSKKRSAKSSDTSLVKEGSLSSANLEEEGDSVRKHGSKESLKSSEEKRESKRFSDGILKGADSAVRRRSDKSKKSQELGVRISLDNKRTSGESAASDHSKKKDGSHGSLVLSERGRKGSVASTKKGLGERKGSLSSMYSSVTKYRSLDMALKSLEGMGPHTDVSISAYLAESKRLGRKAKLPNTYQLTPMTLFSADNVKAILSSSTIKELEKMPVYDQGVASAMAIGLASEIRSTVKTMGYDRYKFSVLVTIGEKKMNGFTADLRCIWDRNTDNYAFHVEQKLTYFILVLCCGLYRE